MRRGDRVELVRGCSVDAVRLSACGGLREALLSFIDEHDRNSVANRIATAALVTDDAVTLQADRGLAERTRQDLHQFLVNHAQRSTYWRGNRPFWPLRESARIIGTG
jgi:hypothetical protein